MATDSYYEDVIDHRIVNNRAEYHMKWSDGTLSWDTRKARTDAYKKDGTSDLDIIQWYRKRTLHYLPPDHWALHQLDVLDSFTFYAVGATQTLTGNISPAMYTQDDLSDNWVLEFGWYLATLATNHLMHHSTLVRNTCATNTYDLSDGADRDDDIAKPGEYPAVFPVVCYSLAKYVKVGKTSHLNVFKLTHPANGSVPWKRHTHTYTESRDVFTQGWPTVPLFVDVCAGGSTNFKDVTNLYTLSNLGSSGVAKTTTASFLGELVHKFVYLDLCRRCNLHLSSTNRFAVAVRETKRQTKGVPLANRLTRVISRRMPVPTWTVFDQGQPSTMTVPGIYVDVAKDATTYGFPRCIPDQILRHRDEWMVCEYKTRYGEKPDTDTSNLTNARDMVVQCIWQAIAFRLCTGHSRVRAKAIEVAIRSNMIARAECRVLEWECSAEALPAWFGWALLSIIAPPKGNPDVYTSNMWIQHEPPTANKNGVYRAEIHKPTNQLNNDMIRESSYVCRFIYSLVRGYAVTDPYDKRVHPIVSRLCPKPLKIKKINTRRITSLQFLEFYVAELNLFDNWKAKYG